MKRLFVIAVMILGLLSVGMVSANAAMAGWHDLSQSQRNQAIVDRAVQDNNVCVGQSCKEWVRTVVYSASGGAVTIPSTVDPPGCWWNYGSYVASGSTRIEWVSPGEIIQMRLRSGIVHTSIVVSMSPYGVTLIESNWSYIFHPNCVYLRYVSFTDFNNQVECFTINYIL